MKKSILFFALLFAFGPSFGNQIDENTAKNVGRNFLSQTNSLTLKSATNLQLTYKASSHLDNQITALFYVFNVGSNGFILVSSDDNVTPILGYSDQGIFDPNNIPQSVAKWFEGYKGQIRYAIENNLQANDEIAEQWVKLKNGTYVNSTSKSVQSVNPLVQTQWNQAPYYNDYCPGGSVTGCVATAMAQVMKYWNYPATGSGFHSYNHSTYGTLSANFGSTTYQWGSMPNTVNSTNYAVATLMYHCGVSVDMNYSPQVSGAYVISDQSPVTNCSEFALKTYFGYQTSLQGIERANYTQSQWVTTIKSELDASRPVLYAGFGSGGGHCFVADGYDNNDYFHFNWGWGGAYDGFFQINALNPSGTGTGGGSGGYNSGHQAVIGIQPPASSQTYNLGLYDNVTPTSSTIYYGNSFDVNTNIANYGANTFVGDYAAAIFDDSYNFVDYVEILSGYTLQGSSAYTNNLVFSTSGILSMLPGTYYVSIFYQPTGGNWQQVADGSYSNLTQITVINPNDIELNANMVVSPNTTLVQGSSASVNLNIVNDGANAFIGQYQVNLYNLDGTFAQSIQTMNENNGLPSGYTYQTPYLTFSTSSITVTPGSYLLALVHNPNNTGWQLTGSSYYQNPIRVIVIAPTLQPDIYENNNVANQSYSLPVSFTSNNATSNTVGSNAHITSDYDFYKVVLPSGYYYTLTPRIHDSYNSGNGITYSLDALFSYSIDGTNWSTAYDDVMSSNITVSGGGTVYFHVAPFFAGETGTYLLDIPINRTSTVGISESEATIKLYPNPTKEDVSIDLNEYSSSVNQINVFNIQGQRVLPVKRISNEKIFKLAFDLLPDGIYFVQFETNRGIITKKVVVSR